MIRIGYKAASEQFGPTALVAAGVDAEAAGFDGVIVSDHLQPWRHSDGHAPLSFAVLAALAVRTTRVELGTSVVTPTFRYHPAIVAQAMATVDALAPGRTMLGVGTGESMNEVPVLGVAWPPFAERLARLEEAVQLIRRLWTETRVTGPGPFYKTRDLTVYDRPAGRIPVLVAASGPRAARFAGQFGDGLICTSLSTLDRIESVLLAGLRAGASAADRDPAGLRRLIELKVSFHPERAAAEEATRYWAALALSAEVKHGISDPMEMERRAAAVADRAPQYWLVSTTAAEHLEQIRPFVAAGFTDLVVHSPDPDQRAFIRRYQPVLEAIRALGGPAGRS